MRVLKSSIEEVKRMCEDDALDTFVNNNNTNVRFKLRDFNLKIVYNVLTFIEDGQHQFYVQVTHTQSEQCLFSFFFKYENHAEYVLLHQEYNSELRLFSLKQVRLIDRCRYLDAKKNDDRMVWFPSKEALLKYLSEPSDKQEILMALVRVSNVKLPSELLLKLMYDFL